MGSDGGPGRRERLRVLLRKDRPDAVGLEPDCVGLSFPNAFVVGCGLDLADCWRHLPCVADLTEGDSP